MNKREFVDLILSHIGDDTKITFLVDGLEVERYTDYEYDSSSMSQTRPNELLIYLRRVK